MKDISIESFLSNLFFNVIEIETKGDGVLVEEKGTIKRCDRFGWNGDV